MIKPPNWAQNAIPTTRGWVNSKGELLKSQNIAAADIKEYLDPPKAKVENTTMGNKKPVTLTEAPVNKSVEDMTETEEQNVSVFSRMKSAFLTEENKNED